MHLGTAGNNRGRVSESGAGIHAAINKRLSQLTPGQRAQLALVIILAIGVALRLYGFTASILDHHFLRQVDTAALARNFAEEGMDLFHPRVDWRGASSGAVEAEFQIYTYMIAILYRLFGEHIELARSLNLVFYILAGIVLYDFARRLFDRPTALVAVFCFSIMPLSIFAAHSVQPDTLMLMASLTSLYAFFRWGEEQRDGLIILSALALCIALLIKPLNLYLGAPLLYICFRKFGWALFRNWKLWAFAAAVLVPAALWYLHAYGLWVEHGNTLYRPYAKFTLAWLYGVGDGAPALSLRHRSFVSDLAWRGMFLISTPGLLLAVAVGVLAGFRQRTWLFAAWAGGFAVTMILFEPQHFGHDYYQLPLTPLVAMLAALGLVQLWRRQPAPRWLVLGLLAVYVAVSAYWFWMLGLPGAAYDTSSPAWLSFAIAGAALLLAFALRLPLRPLVVASLSLAMAFGIWQNAGLSKISRYNVGRADFGSRVFALTDPGARIVVARSWSRRDWFQHRSSEGELLGYDPVDLYLSHRKGWSIFGDTLSSNFIETLRQRGARYFVSYCCAGGVPWILTTRPEIQAYLACAYTPLEVNERWVIYRLDPPRSRPDCSSCLQPESVTR